MDMSNAKETYPVDVQTC